MSLSSVGLIVLAGDGGESVISFIYVLLLDRYLSAVLKVTCLSYISVVYCSNLQGGIVSSRISIFWDMTLRQVVSDSDVARHRCVPIFCSRNALIVSLSLLGPTL